MIQSFKAVTTRRINRILSTPGASLWQRNYYEHIIRNEQECQNIRHYIATNPATWEEDEHNPASPHYKEI